MSYKPKPRGITLYEERKGWNIWRCSNTSPEYNWAMAAWGTPEYAGGTWWYFKQRVKA